MPGFVDSTVDAGSEDTPSTGLGDHERGLDGEEDPQNASGALENPDGSLPNGDAVAMPEGCAASEALQHPHCMLL